MNNMWRNWYSWVFALIVFTAIFIFGRCSRDYQFLNDLDRYVGGLEWQVDEVLYAASIDETCSPVLIRRKQDMEFLVFNTIRVKQMLGFENTPRLFTLMTKLREANIKGCLIKVEEE